MSDRAAKGFHRVPQQFKKDTFWKWFKSRLKYFCSVTALHGCGHIVRENAPLWERIVWVVVIAISLVASIILLRISWVWNSEYPVVTVIESTHYATWNIPFPSVTVCNLNKISMSAALQFAGTLKRDGNRTDLDIAMLFNAMVGFQNGLETDSVSDELVQILRVNNVTILQLKEAISPTCINMFERCMWKGTQTRCDTLFQSVDTSYGDCCSFNYYGLEKNKYHTKIVHSIPKEPRRVTACGFQTGLSVIMTPQINDYHTTVVGSYGFRVLIHDAYDFPDQNSESKVITSRLESFFSIAPEATYFTPDVAALPPATRDCYGPADKKLTVFEKYSFVNCMAECRSQIAFERCGCVPYLMPNNGSYPTCELEKLTCVQTNKNFWDGAYPGHNNSIFPINSEEIYGNCPCRPDCESVQYPTEISTGLFTRNNSYNSRSFFKDVVLTDQSLMHVFFTDLVSTRYRMDIYQTWLGTLATFGGILGLFLGFSLITGFEFIYLFTVRVLFDKYTLYKKRK